jgi:hypothetical protein
LVKQVTGLDSGSPTLRAIVGSFEALKPFADFGAPPSPQEEHGESEQEQEAPQDHYLDKAEGELRFSYTIYLNLPPSTDIAVFNAIFKSLRENLLQR